MQCFNCNSGKLVYNSKKDAYICLDCEYEFPKQYFFISHSHLDIEKVRIIRDLIEETFFYEPILFFLKCISDDDELNVLLKREISERIWFVYCKSDKAENSKYVQAEVEWYKELKRRGKNINYIEVELDKFNIWDESCKNYIRGQIEAKIKKTKLFISYVKSDSAVYNELHKVLTDSGYSVWDMTDLTLADDWSNTIESAIKQHSYKDGAILFLVSEASVNSRFAMKEIERAYENGAMIIPVVIEKAVCDRSTILNRLAEKAPWLAAMKQIAVDLDAAQLFAELIADIQNW